MRITEQDRKKISTAIASAEKNTSGEITAAVIKQSSNYAAREMIFATIATFIVTIFFLIAAPAVQNYLERRIWEMQAYQMALIYAVAIFILLGLFYLLSNLSFIDRLIVPKAVMNKFVWERAVRHFHESGVASTRDRTGILIFVSFLERRVELIADAGINAKIDPKEWQNIVDSIIEGVRTKQFVEKLELAVGKCGELLAKHFPIKPDDENELTNEFQVLED